MIDTRTRNPDDVSAQRRVMIYSHDTFGLGHLRRSRTIANAIVQANPGLRALIVSGSAVVDRFPLLSGVTSVRLPAVTKRGDGYASGQRGVPLERTVAARAVIIARTVEAFRPHLMLVDKEPTGFQGEMLPALEDGVARGCKLVLGLRDVLDDDARLVPEWERKGAGTAMRRFYDEVWIYGVRRIHEPIAAIPIAAEIADRLIYTGYLRRDLPDARAGRREPQMADRPFLLVTPGGGGDGEALIDWVIAAYEADPSLAQPALIAFGPFMPPAIRAQFLARIARVPDRLAAITFDTEIERLMQKAAGIVAMGGYNTFCEILSFDKRALLVPRTYPRREQLIRALAADVLGLARILPEEGRDPLHMAAALKSLPGQFPPSRVVEPGLLDGLDVIVRRVRALLADAPAAAASNQRRRAVG